MSQTTAGNEYEVSFSYFSFFLVSLTPPRTLETMKVTKIRTSLAAQWLRLCMVIAKGMGLIPGQGTKISYASSAAKKRGKSSEDG